AGQVKRDGLRLGGGGNGSVRRGGHGCASAGGQFSPILEPLSVRSLDALTPIFPLPSMARSFPLRVIEPSFFISNSALPVLIRISSPASITSFLATFSESSLLTVADRPPWTVVVWSWLTVWVKALVIVWVNPPPTVSVTLRPMLIVWPPMTVSEWAAPTVVAWASPTEIVWAAPTVTGWASPTVVVWASLTVSACVLLTVTDSAPPTVRVRLPVTSIVSSLATASFRTPLIVIVSLFPTVSVRSFLMWVVSLLSTVFFRSRPIQ